VSPDKLVVSTGFNGLARHISDDAALLADTEEKLRLICHAEANAIFNAARMGVALSGCSIYVNKFPCLACCNAIVQAGITRLYTHDHRYWDDDPGDPDHSRKKYILHQAGVQVVAPNRPDFVPAHLIDLKAGTHTRKAPGQAKASKRLTKMEDSSQRPLFR
jgi:deoxycytidylate deaminase